VFWILLVSNFNLLTKGSKHALTHYMYKYTMSNCDHFFCCCHLSPNHLQHSLVAVVSISVVICDVATDFVELVEIKKVIEQHSRNLLIAQTHRPFQPNVQRNILDLKWSYMLCYVVVVVPFQTSTSKWTPAQGGQVQFTATFTFQTAWARDTSCRLRTDRRIELVHQVHNPAAQPHHSSSENDSRKAC
jgi:hypothetical protein